MATSNPATAEETIHGVILRTSASFSGRYAYFPFPHNFPTAAGDPNLNSIFSDSLAAAPHFPNITIFDSISCTILYQTFNSFPDFFHVYNLINRSHFPIPFPFPFPHLAAGIAIHECIHFKILVVCIEEHSNPFFSKSGDDRGSNPLAFYIYSSQHRNWSRLRNHFSDLTSDQLLPNRKNPVHAGEDVVYLDLTDRFLFRFTASKERIDPIPKLVSSWERNSIKLDESTRYGECKGMLHCAKFNPVKNRVEIYVWVMDPPNGLWRLAVSGREGNLKGRVIGINPNDASFVFVRSKVSDSISMVQIQRDLEWMIVGGRGEKCGKVCLLKGMNDLLEAALEGGRKLELSGCDILHPHENDEGSEGEIFIFSLSGTQFAVPK